MASYESTYAEGSNRTSTELFLEILRAAERCGAGALPWSVPNLTGLGSRQVRWWSAKPNTLECRLLIVEPTPHMKGLFNPNGGGA